MSKKHTTPDIQEQAEEQLNKGVEYVHNNGKKIGITLLVVLVLVAGFLAYRNLYRIPHQKAGDAAIYQAERYFAMDSFQLALEGNGADIQGFLDVIKEYSSTDAGNLAQAYAGICYYHLGQTDKAIEHLKKFKSEDVMAAPAIHGLIGDCYIDAGQTEEGIKYFEDAAKKADNDLISPIFLQKAGLAYQELGQNDKALKAFRTIKEKYYASPVAAEVEKNIAELSIRK